MFFGSFSTKVPELGDEGWSDHLLAGEHRPGSGVSGAGAEPGVDSRVFGEIDVGVQNVGADGVLEGWIPVISQWLGRPSGPNQVKTSGSRAKAGKGDIGDLF